MNKYKSLEVLTTIKKINETFLKRHQRDPLLYYMNGHCYYYAKLLQHFFKDGKLFYNESHVITKIDNFYYDVKGIVPIYDDKEYIAVEDDIHEEYVKMILAPKRAKEDLEINEYIIKQINNDLGKTL